METQTKQMLKYLFVLISYWFNKEYISHNIFTRHALSLHGKTRLTPPPYEHVGPHDMHYIKVYQYDPSKYKYTYI